MSAQSPSLNPLEKVAVALDTSKRREFSAWCRLFGPRVGVLKVGLEAYTRWGPWAFEEAGRYQARLFADLKLHDIPSTVAGAVRAVREHGAAYLTVHASGGTPMLERAAEAAEGEIKLLAVTLLTHLDRPSLDALGLEGEARDRATAWARLARGAGCAGAVCSPLEVADLRRALGPPFELVTPGIRWSELDAGDDQRRTASPASAVAAGSDLLVVGRPLTRAVDPERALAALAAALA